MRSVHDLERPADARAQRQLHILALCARGLTREEIGRQLYLSPWTVKVDLDRLREAIGARNVTHAVSLCMIAGHLVVSDEEIMVAARPRDLLLVAA